MHYWLRWSLHLKIYLAAPTEMNIAQCQHILTVAYKITYSWSNCVQVLTKCDKM